MCVIIPIDHIACTHTVAVWQHCPKAPKSPYRSKRVACPKVRQHPRPILTRKRCFNCGGPRVFQRVLATQRDSLVSNSSNSTSTTTTTDEGSRGSTNERSSTAESEDSLSDDGTFTYQDDSEAETQLIRAINHKRGVVSSGIGGAVRLKHTLSNVMEEDESLHFPSPRSSPYASAYYSSSTSYSPTPSLLFPPSSQRTSCSNPELDTPSECGQSCSWETSSLSGQTSYSGRTSYSSNTTTGSTPVSLIDALFPKTPGVKHSSAEREHRVLTKDREQHQQPEQPWNGKLEITKTTTITTIVEPRKTPPSTAILVPGC